MIVKSWLARRKSKYGRWEEKARRSSLTYSYDFLPQLAIYYIRNYAVTERKAN